ncbi:hypothetical protein ASD64_19370 [Mesorhizobium sp. Root157]|uniref:hypothetical protein n=1 Tax=Mesorhizobium sp. Root157 TaxID=1736477 RepID=UPI0006F8F98F|nr:hypothetical protein [Mesorhizobium sp. Root157]KQZ92262.1 hypothetical protein ASD64_19370 [Mesorhizobium sp. Root157]
MGGGMRQKSRSKRVATETKTASEYGIPSVQRRPFISFGPSAERNALCKRLGIKPHLHDDFGISIWAHIGICLAHEQPEFDGGRRKRGRPSLKELGKSGIDYQRYNYLRNRCREAGEVLGKTVTQQAAIERAMDEGVALFSGELDLLMASVSRGHGVFKGAEHECLMLFINESRNAIAQFRERAAWLESVKGDVTRIQQLDSSPKGLSEFLGVASLERLELEGRLRNPFRVYKKID